MQVTGIPGCCTAQVVFGFGGANHNFYGRPQTEEQIETQLAVRCSRAKAGGMGIMIAFTNSEQEFAEKALKKAGFRSTRKVTKGAHCDTTVRLWYKLLDKE